MTTSRRDGGPSGTLRQIVSPDDASADLSRFVRSQCIHRREPTLEQLSAQSGVALNRLRRLILQDDIDPRRWRLDEALSVAAVLGPAAMTASLARIDMHADRDGHGHPTMTHAVSDLLGGSAELIDCAEDFRIVRREVGKVDRALARIRRAVGTMTAAARGAR